jgi:hypothetical protein
VFLFLLALQHQMSALVKQLSIKADEQNWLSPSLLMAIKHIMPEITSLC